MGIFILRRILQVIPVIILVSIFSFMILNFAPGDPLYMYTTAELSGSNMSEEDLQEFKESLGLDGNLVEQYLKWGKNIIQGNWGKSVVNYQPVKVQIIERIPATVGLMGFSLIFAIIVAIPLGLIAGVNRNKWIDNLIGFITYIGISIPTFWFGTMLIITFSLNIKLLPSSGMRTVGLYSNWDLIKHSILPMIVLSFQNMAIFIRYIRSSTIEQMQEEYVLTAISKGVFKKKILFNHVLKNCLLPVITIVGMNFSSLVAGSFIVEYVFGWPGIGTLGMTAINSRDYTLIMGVTMLSCVILLIGNLLADIIYMFADPRIKQGRGL